MHYLFFSFLIQFLFSFAALAMIKPADAGMVKINSVGDLMPFAGKIVACIAKSSYFGLTQCYPINNSGLKYGHISKGSSFFLTQIVEVGTEGRSGFLNDNFLLRSIDLKMRVVDSEELAGLYDTLKNEKSEFELPPLSGKNGLQLLDEQLGFTLQKNKIL